MMVPSPRSPALPLSVVFALLLASCGGGSSSGGTPAAETGGDTGTSTDADASTDGGTDDSGSDGDDSTDDNDSGGDGGDVSDNGSAALSCVGPFETQVDWVTMLDAPDYDVFDDLFVPDFDLSPSTPQEIATFNAVPLAGAALISMQGAPIYFHFELAACNYEVYAENQCQTPLFSVDSASMTNGALAFTETLDDATVSITISDPEYTSGTLQRIHEDGSTWNMSFSRDADGTERFNSFDSDGASSEFIEFPDCSGVASSVYASSDGEPGATMNGNWNSPTSTPFAATFEYCDTVEGVIQCDTFTRP